jgi:hypothetical protein
MSSNLSCSHCSCWWAELLALTGLRKLHFLAIKECEKLSEAVARNLQDQLPALVRIQSG